MTQSFARAPLGCIVRHRGVTVFQQFLGGLAPDSVFEIGSIRKSFTSGLVGWIAERGDFSVHFKAGAIWPELAKISGDPSDTDITLHHLISGVSGWLTPDPPGVRFLYNSAASTAAERVLARLLRSPRDELALEIARRFKGPLGALSWNIYHFPGRLTGGDLDNPGPKLAVDSTLADLATWGELWCNMGRWRGQQLIPEAYVRLATSIVNPDLSDSHYGYGWFVNAGHALWPRAPEDSYGHPGYGSFLASGALSRAFLWVCPSLQVVATIVTHASTGFCDDFLKVPNALTAECVARIASAF